MLRRFVGLALCYGLTAACVPAYVPELVTTDKLLSLTKDMTYEQVEAILGPPLCIHRVEDAALDEAQREQVRALVEDCGTFQRVTRSVPPDLRRAAHVTLSYAEPRVQDFGLNIYVIFRAGFFAAVYIEDGDTLLCCFDVSAGRRFYAWDASRDRLVELVGR